MFAKYADTTIHLYSEAKPYYIIVWKNIAPRSINIIRSLNDSAAIIRVNSQSAFESISQQAKTAMANDKWKLSPAAVKELDQGTQGVQNFILTGLNIDTLLTVLETGSKDLSILIRNRPSQSVIVQCKSKYIEDRLLPLKDIIFIDKAAKAHTETGIIGYDRSFHGINAVDYTVPGANGKNIVAGVKEQKMEEADIDLYLRVLPSPIAATTVSNHATVISSIIGGAGNSFYDGRGIAYGCKFFPSSFDNLFADDPAILNASNVTVQNHSYGTIIQQFYGAEAVSYDAHSWRDTSFIHVFSAGNQGVSAASEGRYANMPGYANLTGNFKMAKNIITVGAVDNKGNIPAESSAGPLYDGRLAPQLIALGPSGTSDAAAIVSGTIAVMQQVYSDSNDALPPAALIKAVLYNCAEDIYTTGIDYKTGYGLLNSYTSIKAIQQKKYDGGVLSQNQESMKSIFVPANAAQLKITLAWSDSPSTVNNNKALINDLDLEVEELNNHIVYKPWVLNSSANIDSLAQPAMRKRDSLNTSEQVSIQRPGAGNYRIKVIGTAVTASSLPFQIAYNIDTLNTFRFTNPQHASDVNRTENENLTVKWKTFVADTNGTGNLYISYNKGVDWQLLQQSIKIYTNQYAWKIKDTNSIAVFKMETSFGVFFSKDFIISKVIRLTVEFQCTDSFQLSWNRHIYANAYRIFALTDSPYLTPILTVSDTFKVLQKADYPYLVYAVEPLLNNGLPAARSVALNIQMQGVQCFYKTLNYNLLDKNVVNLILELSTANYVDSVFFEGVTTNGQWLQTYGTTKVNGNTLLYNQLVSNLPGGVIYFRGLLKLKNGAIVYTDIISVLTTGQQPIVFYPNPASRNNKLNYVLKQGISADSRLQLFDVMGRLLKDFSSFPGPIDISAFPPGIILYKLTGRENNLLGTGKIITTQK